VPDASGALSFGAFGFPFGLELPFEPFAFVAGTLTEPPSNDSSFFVAASVPPKSEPLSGPREEFDAKEFFEADDEVAAPLAGDDEDAAPPCFSDADAASPSGERSAKF
jgi:hypothetical protein